MEFVSAVDVSDQFDTTSFIQNFNTGVSVNWINADSLRFIEDLILKLGVVKLVRPHLP